MILHGAALIHKCKVISLASVHSCYNMSIIVFVGFIFEAWKLLFSLSGSHILSHTPLHGFPGGYREKLNQELLDDFVLWKMNVC